MTGNGLFAILYESEKIDVLKNFYKSAEKSPINLNEIFLAHIQKLNNMYKKSNEGYSLIIYVGGDRNQPYYVDIFNEQLVSSIYGRDDFSLGTNTGFVADNIIPLKVLLKKEQADFDEIKTFFKQYQKESKPQINNEINYDDLTNSIYTQLINNDDYIKKGL